MLQEIIRDGELPRRPGKSPEGKVLSSLGPHEAVVCSSVRDDVDSTWARQERA